MSPPISSPVKTWVFTILLLCISINCVFANVEKVIFTGPLPSARSNIRPLLSSIENIHTLTHDDLSVRTNLDRIFASEVTGLRGQSSWILLTNLTVDQRYELRVCWSALEPTRFDMDAYDLDTVLENPKLHQSLNLYATTRARNQSTKRPSVVADSSSLLVEIHSAADYFTDNAELMSNPPPVLVDLILDPFLFNVLPQSLLPTIFYLGLLGITTWFVARFVASGLQSVAGSTEPPAKKRN